MANSAQIQAELDQLRETLTEVRATIRAILAGGTSYTKNTGQTTIQVTRSSLNQLKEYEKELKADIANLERQLSCPGFIVGRPAF